MRIASGILLAILLTDPLLRADDAPSPPNGWKAYAAKDNSFSVWLPEGTTSDKFKTMPVHKGMMLRFTTVVVEGKNGTYEAAGALATPYKGDFARMKATARVDVVRDAFVEASKGKVSDEKAIKQRRISGKEFVIESKAGHSRYRIYAFADRFFIAAVSGTKEQIASTAATTFLDSYKVPDRYAGTDNDK